MATYTLSPMPWFVGFDDSGVYVPGGLLWTYLAGTSTPATTYRTSSGTAHTNPIVLDAAGRPPSGGLYLEPGQSYKFEFETPATPPAHGVVIKTQDDIQAVPLSASNQDVTGIAGEALTAGDAAYESDGSAGLVAGKWYKADADAAYSSTLLNVALVVNDVALNGTGTFRGAGQLTVTGPLVPGSTYFISATPGALTATAPMNARAIGQATSATSIDIAPSPRWLADGSMVCEGRLTLTTGVPVTVSDVTAATTLFFAPYKGNRIAIYDGSKWVVRAFAQLSIAVPSTTATVYDVFVYDNAGVLTLEVAAWNSGTARHAAGVYATLLPTQDGVYVKSTNGTTIDNTRRYVGSFRTTGVSGQTEDSAAKRFLWNYYNRVDRELNLTEATASWTYTTNTWRQARATATNQVEVVIGVQEVLLNLTVRGTISNASSGVICNVSIGQNSTSAPMATAQQGTIATQSTANTYVQGQGSVAIYPAVGYHYFAWLEISTATGATSWYGTADVGTGVAQRVSGLNGSVEG